MVAYIACIDCLSVITIPLIVMELHNWPVYGDFMKIWSSEPY